MERLWTWDGTYFGYRQGDSLFSHGGNEAGRFYGDEVYGADGRYLGELRNGSRLITNLAKSSRIRSVFAPRIAGSHAARADYVGYAMLAGYEDFPDPSEFA